jgi:hypothetical protein
MRKCEIQKLMQAFMLENGILVRWVDGKPGKDQIKNFQKRWKHPVVIKKNHQHQEESGPGLPINHQGVLYPSDTIMQGVLPAHFFSYDETNLKDNPGIGTYSPIYSTVYRTYHLPYCRYTYYLYLYLLIPTRIFIS